MSHEILVEGSNPPRSNSGNRADDRKEWLMEELATTLDARFSVPNAVATKLEEMRRILETASCSGSLRSDSRPHVTPLLAVWLDDAIHFCTGATEQKAVDLGRNSHVILTTGCNHWDKGIDVVVEGIAVQLPCKFLPYGSDGGQCNVCANCTAPG